MGRFWTDKEIEFLENNYNIFSNTELSKKMDRSLYSIEKKLKRLGLKKSSRSLSMKWSDDDINFLKENYSKITNKELSEILRRSPKTILNRASKMGLSKDKNHLSKVAKIRYEENKNNLNNNKTEDIIYKHYCKLCENGFNELDHLQIHLVKKHNFDIEKYYHSYISEVNTCLYCDNKSKFISLKKGYHKICNSEECLSKSRAYNSKEWHILNRGNLMEMEYQTHKRLNSLKIGDIKRLKDNPNYYKEKSHNSPLFWMKRGHTLCESIQKSKEVVENMQSVSHKNRKENPDKYSHTYNTKVEYYLDKGLPEEQATEVLKNRQTTFSKEICIEKYGEKKGIEVWKDRQSKWLETMDSKSIEEKININRKKLFNKSGYSKISVELFNSILNKMSDKYKERTYYATHNNEFIRYNKEIKSYYKLDFVNTELMKCIEFNGDFWHCNPKKYNENHVHKITNKPVNEIWEYDKIKEKFIKENMGFDLLIIWESEYRKDKKRTIQKCIDFLQK